jgi:hypothetical protein
VNPILARVLVTLRLVHPADVADDDMLLDLIGAHAEDYADPDVGWSALADALR